jgi:uncharacterized protein (TIGR00730 family)
MTDRRLQPDPRPQKPVEEASLLEQARNVEQRLLTGRRDRAEDLESAIRVFLEILRGYESLDIDGPCVTVFGSSRFAPDHPYYRMARQLGRSLAEAGYCVMTGGGPGIMEAANRGAQEAGGLSIGCSISLATEKGPNPYLDRFVHFDHFFVRKVMLVKYSCAFVVMPGGFGTLDEVFETLTLIQTEKIEDFPVIALGNDFWQRLQRFLEHTLLAERTIRQDELDLLFITDSIKETMDIICEKCPCPAQAGG